ncbi:DUF1636 family protein [Actinomycetospora termitidis]|uniref:DUF1636 family protein n=1 Tax=Actinomycetospora termitidis TaxID=3053470 RepID=A0ABT7MDY7_9PSEU|nr:DUF1636 family protein [Actinomycetospora sp. Odt1-22]MDL5158875.1 DUF1636 family protein [Actinomycetospora sp. Odt1-22]
MPLLVCRTCPRDRPDTGSFGAALDGLLTGAAERGVRVRHVPCLGGCPNDGNVAVDAPGKPRVRFSHLSAADAPSLLDAAAAFDASENGLPDDDWVVPSALSDRLTAVTPKRVV